MWINIKDNEGYMRMINTDNVTSVAYNNEVNASAIIYVNETVTYVNGNILPQLKRALPTNDTSLVTIQGE